MNSIGVRRTIQESPGRIGVSQPVRCDPRVVDGDLRPPQTTRAWGNCGVSSEGPREKTGLFQARFPTLAMPGSGNVSPGAEHPPRVAIETRDQTSWLRRHAQESGPLPPGDPGKGLGG